MNSGDIVRALVVYLKAYMFAVGIANTVDGCRVCGADLCDHRFEMCWYSDQNFHSFNNRKSGMVKSGAGSGFAQ